MLTSLKLSNFRRFEDHTVPFKRTTVLVGANNAGKSTIVEAIRLVSLVANRSRNLTFYAPPSWIDMGVGQRGVSPSLRDLNTDLESVFHAFAEPPATVEAKFDDGASISIYIGPKASVFAVIRDPDGKVVASRSQAFRVALPRIAIQPQVAPVARNERPLDTETVRRGMDSPLAPLHFRNQLRLGEGEAMRRFRELAETTWPTMQIRELTPGTEEEDFILSLFVRDGAFVGELATMGHGLQMWLQVMWFLARNSESPTVVLDEPDVYMHADLQRKLMRLLRRTYQQVIVATHSVEIMAEVDAADILIVNGGQTRSRWATNSQGVQKVIDQIGGVHNLQLSRLAQARKCLFVEGDDVDILKQLHDTLYPEADALDVLPRLSVGGWDGWQKVLGTAQFLRTNAGNTVDSYSLFDSDHHLPAEIVSRLEEAQDLGIRLHVWTRKEIENYLLDANAILRLMRDRARPRWRSPSLNEVSTKLLELIEEAVDDAVDGYATNFLRANRGSTAGTCSRWARQFVKRRLAVEEPLAIVPGKKIVRGMSAWSESLGGPTFGASTLARYLEAGEIPAEMRELLTCIEEVTPLPAGYSENWSTLI